MVSIGIDIGSVCTKGALFDGKNMYKAIIPTGWNHREAGENIFRKLIEDYGIKKEQVGAIIGTGYGRISIGFAHKKITEITCHAKGAVYLNPDTRTIIDVGGQDSKVISVNERGNVLEFIMNDKCAAGTGRFLQVMAHVLETEVDKLEELSKAAEPRDINSMCAVFAESEVISLLAQGVPKESVASGILYSISNKIIHLTNRVNIRDTVLFTGGVAANSIIRDVLSRKLKRTVVSHIYSQFAGAVGAALLGYEEIKG